MLDLLHLARQAANTVDRQDLLMAALEDDAHGVRKVMERNEEHGHLLANDFFLPFIGICAATGSRALWHTLGEWGYSFHSDLQHYDEPGQQAQMSVGGWAARALEPGRLEWLIEQKLLDAFTPSAQGMRHSPAELGMLADDDLFDFWLGQWKRHAQAHRNTHTPEQLARMAPRLPLVLETLVGMEEVHARQQAYPEAWPDVATVKARKLRLMDALAEVHYGAQDPQQRWEAFLARPPLSRRDSCVVAFCQHLAAAAAHPFQENMLDPYLHKQSTDLVMVRALLESGAPLSSGRPEGLAARLLELVCRWDKEKATPAWGAWVQRAREEMPWMVETLPGGLKEPGLDYARRASQDKDGTARVIEALTLSQHAGPASGERARPRL